MTSADLMPGRRVSELTAAELLEAAVAALAGLGCTRGRWHLDVVVDEGSVRKLRARSLSDSPAPVTMGRRDLVERRIA